MSEILELKKQLEKRRERKIEEILKIEEEALRNYAEKLRELLRGEVDTIAKDIEKSRKALKIASLKMLLMSFITGFMSALLLIAILYEITVDGGQILLIWRW